MKDKILFVLAFAILFTTSFSYAETVRLKSGKKIEGKILERTDKYIRINFFDVPLTFYLDEIEGIDEKNIDATKGYAKRSDYKTAFEILDLREEEIEIATALFALTKEYDNTVDINRYSEIIDNIVGELNKRISGVKDQKKIISIINDYLFNTLSYKKHFLPFGAPWGKEDLKFSLLPFVLDNKKGTCNGLTALYFSIAQRLNLPIYAAEAPEHIFLRYDDGSEVINIEVLQDGNEISNEEYINELKIPKSSLEKGVFLRNLTKREYMALFSNVIAQLYLYNDIPDTDKAIALLKKALSFNFSVANLHIALGVAYIQKGLLDSAISEFLKELEINPNEISARAELAVVYAKQGKIDMVSEELNNALEIEPDYGLAHKLLVIVNIEKKDYSLAWQHAKKAAQLGYPNDSSTIITLARMFDNQIREDLDAVSKQPFNSVVCYNLGHSYLKEGFTDQAMGEFEKALKFNPNYADAHHNLGVCYMRKSLFDKGINEFLITLKLESNSAKTYLTLGMAYLEKNDKTSAMEEYEKLKKIDNNLAEKLLNEINKQGFCILRRQK